ncbi:MAG: DsbA family protein, partial [Alphaproteobacteria bacterium]|nr:DsbA family protein [Alphaproteobacteria bacterium]
AATRSGMHYAVSGFAADPDRARIEKVVHDYILAHPEIIPEAMKRLQEGEIAKAVEAHRARFETPFAGAWAGAEKGDVVLVEFFDYACGFCRASNPDIARLLKEDKDLKVVWRELPVLGEDSIAAAQASLAAAKQGRFRAFHDRLFAAGQPDRAAVAAAQTAVGVTAAPSPEFQREIEQNLELARAVNATGTPTFVIGARVIQGAVGYQALKDAIAEARKRS